MKKLLRGICLMGVVALLATSCNKKETSMVYRAYSYDQTFDIEYGDIEEGSRVYIDDNYRVMFEEGDQVMLYNVDSDDPTQSVAAMYVVDATSNQPTLSPVGSEIPEAMMTAKYAFYPGNNVNTDDLANENRSTFTLNTVQTYAAEGIAKDALYMAAKIDNEDETGNNFAFRNICGILVMKFYNPDGKSIENITVTDNTHNLTGDVTLKVDEVDPGRMMGLFRNYDPNDPNSQTAVAGYMEEVGYAVANAGNVLTLDCGGVALGTSAAEATTFYFVLRPLALMNGFDMVITFTDGTTKTITTTRDNKIKPNTLRVFPALKVA